MAFEKLTKIFKKIGDALDRAYGLDALDFNLPAGAYEPEEGPGIREILGRMKNGYGEGAFIADMRDPL